MLSQSQKAIPIPVTPNRRQAVPRVALKSSPRNARRGLHRAENLRRSPLFSSFSLSHVFFVGKRRLGGRFLTEHTRDTTTSVEAEIQFPSRPSLHVTSAGSYYPHPSVYNKLLPERVCPFESTVTYSPITYHDRVRCSESREPIDKEHRFEFGSDGI